MNDVPDGTVRVRLASGPDRPPYAEFHLSEADLAWRIDPTGDTRHKGTVAYQAAETAWGLTHIAAERQNVEEWGLPREYESQIDAFARTGRPGMTVGELAEVTRASGARSVWRCTHVDWMLLERLSATMAERAAQDAERDHEAER